MARAWDAYFIGFQADTLFHGPILTTPDDSNKLVLLHRAVELIRVDRVEFVVALIRLARCCHMGEQDCCKADLGVLPRYSTKYCIVSLPSLYGRKRPPANNNSTIDLTGLWPSRNHACIFRRGFFTVPKLYKSNFTTAGKGFSKQRNYCDCPKWQKSWDLLDLRSVYQA